MTIEQHERRGSWGRRDGLELAFVTALMVVVFVSIPLTSGSLGLSSDTLNHHVYLGWEASASRFGWDFLAASHQSYQYPYLYWPLYVLAVGGFGGAAAGAVLSLLHVVVIPPVWLMARAAIPGASAYHQFMRLVATALAFSSGLVLMTFTTTHNDVLAAAPLLWAIALAVNGGPQQVASNRRQMLILALSGVLAGMSVAFKLSNGPLAILLPLLWLLHGSRWKDRLAYAGMASVACVLAFLAFYAPWGWQLWRHFGNPLYPMADGMFAPLRDWTGWRP